mmetsp:Transcript_24551/g.68438  ORF Transcript_24551/g.68438 Transcript_24551/m.68438 type:complete len:139 (-) Transcript_24551:37-453(-)
MVTAAMAVAGLEKWGSNCPPQHHPRRSWGRTYVQEQGQRTRKEPNIAKDDKVRAEAGDEMRIGQSLTTHCIAKCQSIQRADENMAESAESQSLLSFLRPNNRSSSAPSPSLSSSFDSDLMRRALRAHPLSLSSEGSAR